MRSLELYQVEVKLHLIKCCFHPTQGWRVTTDVDAMEMGKGKLQSAEKIERAQRAVAELESLGVHVGIHNTWGRVDVVADHREHGVRLIEVEGKSRKQKEQAVYSALGQLALTMKAFGTSMRFGLAVPDTRAWRKQLAKIPKAYREAVRLDMYAVANGGLSMWDEKDVITEWGR